MGNSNSNRQLGYEIRTKTGDKKGSGADVNIHVTLISEDHRRSHDLHLDCKWRDDFEAGSMDTFEFDDIPDIGPIRAIEVRRMAGWWKSEWFLEWIEVINHHRPEDEPDIFPSQRWVKSGIRFLISKYDCILPQFDEFPGQRLLELERKRNDYVLSEKEAGIPKQVIKRNGLRPNDIMAAFFAGTHSIMGMLYLQESQPDETENLAKINVYMQLKMEQNSLLRNDARTTTSQNWRFIKSIGILLIQKPAPTKCAKGESNRN